MTKRDQTSQALDGAVFDNDLNRFDGWLATPSELALVLLAFALVSVLILGTVGLVLWLARACRAGKLAAP